MAEFEISNVESGEQDVAPGAGHMTVQLLCIACGHGTHPLEQTEELRCDMCVSVMHKVS